MADISKTGADVRPLNMTIREPYELGEAIDVGEAVYLKSDGKIWLSDADTAAESKAIGIVVGIGGYGALSGVAGDMADVVLYGPVAGFSGMTPGADVFASTTPGAIEDTAPAGASGDFVWVIGHARSASVIFVKPYTYDIAAQ